MKFILAIDQGTSGTKTIVYDDQGNAVAKGYSDLHTNYFANGFVEQDPEDIYQNVLSSVAQCLDHFIQSFEISQIVSCGITNQRETFILWDKSGKAITPAVVWACKRSIHICQRLIEKSQSEFINERTGLIIDPYFSATKLLWLLENNSELKEKIDLGEIYFGTVDCWLLFKFTNGKSFKTDYTNAHRTLLFNIHTLKWDSEILKLWGLEKLRLPDVYPSSCDFGVWNIKYKNDNFRLPVTSLIGDSHAAAFGEGCFQKGTAKVTLGSGSSILLNTGNKPLVSQYGLLATICWSTEDRIDFALEGAIVACGSIIEWLKKELHLFSTPEETELLASSITDNAGIFLIPAFSGLGAPHWQMDRKASIVGMTFGTTKNHLVRAALECIPYQVKDVIDAMSRDMGENITSIAANGGITQNKFVMRFLVDLMSFPIKMQGNPDVSALGVAYLSGLKSGVFKNMNQLKELNKSKENILYPDLDNKIIQSYYENWKKEIRNYHNS